ncbi:hypothetical protein [Bremerella volcania]|uniref:hypothetical protein n=1 Tax=Bremerella volcania TaxID=2527984 RepID=UPI0011AAAA0A|nr:hypothetical protein [Bremerella volcania]
MSLEKNGSGGNNRIGRSLRGAPGTNAGHIEATNCGIMMKMRVKPTLNATIKSLLDFHVDTRALAEDSSWRVSCKRSERIARSKVVPTKTIANCNISESSHVSGLESREHLLARLNAISAPTADFFFSKRKLEEAGRIGDQLHAESVQQSNRFHGANDIEVV